MPSVFFKTMQINNLVLKLALIFLLFNYSLIAKGQNIEEVEVLLDKADSAYLKLNYEIVMENAVTAVEKSKPIGYEKGIVKGNYFIALCLSYLGEFEKSFMYIERAEKHSEYLNEHLIDKYYLQYLRAENYDFSDLIPIAKKEYKNASNILEKMEEGFEKEQAFFLLNIALYSLHSYRQEPDLAYEFLKKARKIVQDKKYKGKGSHLDRSLLSIHLGDYFRDNSNLDSAQYYYQETIHTIKDSSNYYLTYAYNGLGDVNDSLGNYKKAISFQKMAIQKAKSTNIQPDLETYYRSLTHLYKKTGNSIKEKEYLTLYSELADSLSFAHNKEKDIILSTLLENKDNKMILLKDSKFKTIILFSCILLIVLLSFLGYFYFQKQKIKQKTRESQILQYKVNDAFQEIINLAKDNSPIFLSRFEEVYPEFTQNLYTKHSNLTSSERVFSAMIFLNFSSKDIAQITFIEHRSVQTKKSRLRKKLNIDPGTNLYQYFKTFS